MTIDWQRFPEYDALLLAQSASGASGATIAAELEDRFGVTATKDQVNHRLRRLHALGDEPEPTPMEQFERNVVAEKSRAEARTIAREMASAVKGQARWEEFLAIARDAFSVVTRPQLRQLEIPTGDGTPEMMVVVIGDVHIGKLVDPNVVGDTFGYGMPIFEERWARLKDRILRLFALHSLDHRIDVIRLYFVGDGVDGVDMRRGHAHRVDVPNASFQMLTLTYAFEAMIRELSQLLGVKIEVVWDFGNHGRVGDFGVNLPADNWDYVAGQILGVALRDMIADGSVSLATTPQKYTITDLGPYRVYSSHGDGIKGGDGFAGLPINGLARAYAKDTGLHLQLFDLYLVAHFHTPQDITTQTGRILMNGAWDGGDDYSINQLKAASEPVQWAFGIHPAKGMTWQNRIRLAPARRSASSPEVL